MSARSFSLCQKLLCVSLAFSLLGCEVGPDYEPPISSTPDHWVSQNENLASDKAETDQQWWNTFNDPVLTALIERASTNNYDLKIAEARIEQARAGVSSAFADLFPKADVKGTATREANQLALPGGSSNPFGSLLRKPFNVFQTGFDASWELDLFGAGRRAEEVAEANMDAFEAMRDDIRVSMLAEVARTYIAIRNYQAQLNITADIIVSDASTRGIALERFQVGQSARFDVTQADAAIQHEQSQIPLLQDEIAQQEFAMDVLLGEQPGTSKQIIGEGGTIPNAGKEIVLSAPASIIAQRPDIKVAERKLAGATAQQGVATAKFFPDISLTGFFGALNTSLTNLATPANESWLAGGSVIWPILSIGTLSANLNLADAQQQEAMASYQKAVISALSDVERSLTAYNQQQLFVASTANEVEKNKRVRAIAQERYKEGLTSFLDVLDTERALYASETSLTEARAQASQDLIALYKSLGGGWVKG